MQAFEGIRVVDFTHVLAGPFCAYQLAVMGADVIKVEPPGTPDMMRPESVSRELADAGLGTQFVCQAGNKRSLAVDATKPEGADVLRKLITRADVVVQNYRGETLQRLGFGIGDMRALNGQLIICSITGFGTTGPKANHPAFDNVIQAFSGLMAATGTPDVHPVKVGPPVLDYGTGAQAAFAIAAALFQRSRTGKGQVIDVSMLDAALVLMSTTVSDVQVTGRPPVTAGNSRPDRAGYSCYETAEGLLMLGAFTGRQCARLWAALGRRDLADRDEAASPADMAKTAEADRVVLADLLKGRTAQEWEDVLNDAGVPAARVRTVDEAIHHPQVATRQVLQPGVALQGNQRHLSAPMTAFGFEHDGPMVTSPPARLGEHTEEVLAELGYETASIAELRSSGAIQTA